MQSDVAVFIGVSKDAALKSKDNTFTADNTFDGNINLNSEVNLGGDAIIKNIVNGKAILNTITIDANTEQTYLGGDQAWIKGTDQVLLEGTSIKTKRGTSPDNWTEYTNIDSGNIGDYVSGSAEMEKYGIEADYAVHHGIIDCPQGLIEFNATNKNVTIKAGIVLQAAGQSNRTTIGSDIIYTVQETGKVTLFYTKVGDAVDILEAGDVFYQEAEPSNGSTSYLAWWKPSLGKWQFKSNDTGNVWREAIATPLANVNAGATSIISINYIGYRIFDDDCFASLSDIETINESVDMMQQSINELFTEVGKKQDGLFPRQLLTGTIPTVSPLEEGADLSTVITSFNNLLTQLKARGVIA